MTDTVTLRTTRPLCMRGERVEVGTVLKLAPLAAADVLASGRAELVHADDAVQCIAAVRAEVRAALRTERERWHPPQAEAPWRLVDQRPLP